jgi:hypothetical protein
MNDVMDRIYACACMVKAAADAASASVATVMSKSAAERATTCAQQSP